MKSNRTDIYLYVKGTNNMFKKTAMLLFSSILLLSFTGCGKAKDPDAEFQTQIKEFTDEVNQISSDIDAIDTTDSFYGDLLLAKLDELELLFQELPGYEEPEKYVYYDDLAANATEYMSQAVHYFHLTYDGNDYNPTFIDIANEYYYAAVAELRNIGYLLSGYDVSDVVMEHDYLEQLESEFLQDLQQSTEDTTE